MIPLNRTSLLFPSAKDGLRDILEYARGFAKEGHREVQSVVFGFQFGPHDGSIILVIPEGDHHATGEVR